MKQRLNLFIICVATFAFVQVGFGRQSDDRVVWRFEMSSNFAGAGATKIAMLNITLDLARPVLLATGLSDGVGRYTLRRSRFRRVWPV